MCVYILCSLSRCGKYVNIFSLSPPESQSDAPLERFLLFFHLNFHMCFTYIQLQFFCIICRRAFSYDYGFLVLTILFYRKKHLYLIQNIIHNDIYFYCSYFNNVVSVKIFLLQLRSPWEYQCSKVTNVFLNWQKIIINLYN